MRLPTERKAKKIQSNRQKEATDKENVKLRKVKDTDLYKNEPLDRHEAIISYKGINIGIVSSTKVADIRTEDDIQKLENSWEELIVYLVSYGIDRYGYDKFLIKMTNLGIINNNTFNISSINEDVVSSEVQGLKAKGLYSRYKVYNTGYYVRLSKEVYNIALVSKGLLSICFNEKEVALVKVVNDNYIEIEKEYINDKMEITGTVEELVEIKMKQRKNKKEG